MSLHGHKRALIAAKENVRRADTRHRLSIAGLFLPFISGGFSAYGFLIGNVGLGVSLIFATLFLLLPSGMCVGYFIGELKVCPSDRETSRLDLELRQAEYDVAFAAHVHDTINGKV